MAHNFLADLEALLPAPPTVGTLVEGVDTLLSKHPLHFGHGTQNPSDEAYALVFDLLDLAYDEAEAQWGNPVSDDQIRSIVAGLRKRIEDRLPLPYITGTAWFAGLPFKSDARALIPRSPIAELLESGFAPWLQTERPHILDLCCGGGCIGIAAAVHMPAASVDLADLSADALELARENILRHGVADRVKPIQSDLFAALKGRQYDLIVCNPPYVPASSMAQLPQEYHHEPGMALEAADAGMVIVDKILKESGNYMKNNGILVTEVGEIQAAVEQRYNALPFVWLDFERGGEGVFLLQRQDLAQAHG